MARGSVEERQRLLDSSATPTPLPTARVAILMIVFFADSICLSFVLPIVPFMIKDFEGYSGAQEALGHFTGNYGLRDQQACRPSTRRDKGRQSG